MATEAIPLLTLAEAALELRVSRSSLYRLFRARKLRVTSVGGRRFVRRSEIGRFLEANTRAAR